MRTLIAIGTLAALTACSNAYHSDRIMRDYEARVAAIPAEVDQEFTAKYGNDRSKWPQAPKVQSTCETYYVAVSTGGKSTSGNVLIC